MSRFFHRRHWQEGETIWGVAGLLIAGLQLVFFLPGYRLSADDNLFFLAFIHGWDAVWALSQGVAYGQGRVGGFLLVPINAVAAYLSEFYFARALMIIFDFLLLWVFSAWVQKILSLPRSLMFVFLMAFHALDYLHLSPNAFPMQNSLPFFVVIIVRLFCVHLDSVGLRTLGRLLMGVAMLTSEYAMLFGGVVIAIEMLAVLFREGLPQGVRQLIRSRHAWADALTIALVLALYLWWRWAHPSSYNGNQLGINSLSAFAQTWILHAFGLFLMPVYRPQVSSVFDLIAILTVGGLVGLTTYVWTGTRSAQTALPLLLTGAGFALMVALPASATIKQQGYCEEGLLNCIFLDSRAAYFFAVIALVSALQCLGGKGRLAIAVAIGIWALGMAAHNAGASERMRVNERVWAVAAELACDPSRPVSGVDVLIDPVRRVALHPAGADRRFYPDRAEFWQTYLEWRQSHHCPG